MNTACEKKPTPADLLYLFFTCTGAFCRFLPIELFEFSKSFENSTFVADRLPPPPPTRTNSRDNLRVVARRSRRLHYFSTERPASNAFQVVLPQVPRRFPSNSD